MRDFFRPVEGTRVLDIGCGAGSLLDLLPSSVQYAGFDVNARYIDAARARYGERGAFFCARAGAPPEELLNQPKFHLVVARALLHHLEDDEVRRTVRLAWERLTPGGAFVTIDPVRHEGQPWAARLLLSMDRGTGIRTAEGYRALVEPVFGPVESHLLRDLLPVPYSHFIMRAVRA